jgi:hypothetical protein
MFYFFLQKEGKLHVKEHTHRHVKEKGNQNEAELKSWMTLALFAINHTVKEMILYVAILVSHGLIGTAREFYKYIQI